MNDRPATRTRIVTEATRLFAAQGVKATTVAQIEEAVGLRRGSGGVHRHFPSKDDLVSAVLEHQLAQGSTTLSQARNALPPPTPGTAGEYLRSLGHLVLAEAEKNREVALILLRDGHALGERADAQLRHNDELAYGATAAAVRAVQDQLPDALGLDANAFGYVFLSPLIYFKLIEWASERRPLDITADALVATWAVTMEPAFRAIIEAGQRVDATGVGTTSSPATAPTPGRSRRR